MTRLFQVLAVSAAVVASAVPVLVQSPLASEKLGKVHFETSCSESVTAEFDRAMALLHSFEFPAAISGFEQVLKGDSSCGIAAWGIAMSVWGNPFSGLRAPRVIQDGQAAVDRAQTIGAKTSREREYIDAVSSLYRNADSSDQRTRTKAYEEAMERIYTKYPEDLEAAVFYALAVDQDALPTDKTFANQLKAAAILERLFTIEPDHPGVTHYLIHSYDVPPLAPRGLPYARRYADLAPDAPHALHMPAHTFTRVGLWQESIDTNVRSHDAAIKRGDSGEALHAMDYMTYAYLQTAQDTAAKRVVDELTQIIAKQPPAATGPGIAGGFPAVAIPARYALERNRWSAAINLQARPATQPYIEAMTHFARAMGGVHLERLDILKTELDQLAMLRDKEIAAKDLYWTTQVEIQRQEVEAWMLWLQGGKNQALKTMAAAATLEDTTEKSAVTPGPLAPAHELLGDMLIDAKQPAEALKEYETALQKEPNRFRSVYGAGHAAELAGFSQKARTYYQQLMKICERGERQLRPELDHAASYIGGTR
jgi:tetratricopeptide (TPR) repeat protein